MPAAAVELARAASNRATGRRKNLTDLLRKHGDKSCMTAKLERTEAALAGQATYVIVTWIGLNVKRNGPMDRSW